VLLSKLGIIKDQAAHIDDAIKSLRRLKGERLGMRVKTKDNQAKRIASMLYGRIPFIYAGCEYTDSVATRWRGQLAENSKTLASCNVFPEMNHNELVGWENPRRLLKGCAAVILRDAGDHPKISRRMDITKRILRKEGFEVTEVNSSGKELLARIFSLVYTGDFVSLYLALLNGADPYSVDRITYMKKELAK
jgi:glucose/mannose-6-phosphate isomerase